MPRNTEAKDCLCGCNGKTAGGNFIPGHDAKMKSRLFAEADAGDAHATDVLETRGWMGLYETHCASVAKKSEAKAKSAEKKALAQQVRDTIRKEKVASSGSKKAINTTPIDPIDPAELVPGAAVTFKIGGNLVAGEVAETATRGDGVPMVSILKGDKKFLREAINVGRAAQV